MLLFSIWCRAFSGKVEIPVVCIDRVGCYFVGKTKRYLLLQILCIGALAKMVGEIDPPNRLSSSVSYLQETTGRRRH